MLAPPPIVNSISLILVPAQTIWFNADGSGPVNDRDDGGTTVISTCCVTFVQELVLVPPVVTVNEYVTGFDPTIVALGLPDIVTIPPILSLSSTKSKFKPPGRLIALPKVFSPTTVISIGVISSPKQTSWTTAPDVTETVNDSLGNTVITPVIDVSVHDVRDATPAIDPPGLSLVVIVKVYDVVSVILTLGVPEITNLFGATKLPSTPFGKSITLASSAPVTVYDILVNGVLLQIIWLSLPPIGSSWIVDAGSTTILTLTLAGCTQASVTALSTISSEVAVSGVPCILKLDVAGFQSPKIPEGKFPPAATETFVISLVVLNKTSSNNVFWQTSIKT